ncbi:MAG: NADH-quinone oxidoreductase subunit M [Deltaproteobacteria bacterium]|nr:NADH-quinone oxidoreductase subunit M [Deltaproteobacteria bacterium]
MPDLLTAIVFLPAVGAILLCFFPSEEHRNLKAAALGFALVNFALSVVLWNRFDGNATSYQMVVNVPWIESFGIRYSIGIDGISFLLVMLTTFLMPITLLGAWTAIGKHVREFAIAMLVLETGMLGAFVSLDLFLFYVFWEAMLIPMYFLIGIWGGTKRIYAAIKFFLFTFAASLLMLIAILYVAHQPDGAWNFGLDAGLRRTFTSQEQTYLFLAFALAFAVKVPMFPVHTWLPDAHTEAPTPGSVILAGVLLKLGVYGFIRFAFPLFPHAAMAFAPALGWLAVIGIVYGALAAWVQPDMKKLVAYSSVSHLGFCMLGLGVLTVEGVTGSIYQMLAHGISTSALFTLVGVLYERRHTRLLADYGGIARKVPVFAFFLVLISMASAGLPTLCGFPAEFLILSGTFTGGAPLDAIVLRGDDWVLRLNQVLAIVAATGVIFAAVYLLWMVQKVLFGPLQDPHNEELKDMNAREIAVLVPFAVMAVLMGLLPGIFFSKMERSVEQFVSDMNRRVGRVYAADLGAKRPEANAPILLKEPEGRFPVLRPVLPRPDALRPARLLDGPRKIREVE